MKRSVSNFVQINDAAVFSCNNCARACGVEGPLPETTPNNPTREQVRAARALLGLTGDQLATQAGVGVATVRRYEGGAEIGALQLDAIGRALDAAGVVLIEDGSQLDGRTVGIGVALKKRSRSLRRLGPKLSATTLHSGM
jgi:transcriptional regulator with XRE-family HTH domain